MFSRNVFSATFNAVANGSMVVFFSNPGISAAFVFTAADFRAATAKAWRIGELAILRGKEEDEVTDLEFESMLEFFAALMAAVEVVDVGVFMTAADDDEVLSSSVSDCTTRLRRSLLRGCLTLLPSSGVSISLLLADGPNNISVNKQLNGYISNEYLITCCWIVAQ